MSTPYLVHQIALNLFGDRYIVVNGNTVQFHNHCYYVRCIDTPGHPHRGDWYVEDANTGLAMLSDETFAPPGDYGTIFERQTGDIVVIARKHETQSDPEQDLQDSQD